MILRISRYLPLASVLLVTACNGGVAPVDSREFLDSLDGPEVQNMVQTLQQSATQAELAGNFRMAAQIYEQILEKKPHNLEVMQSLGDCLRRDGQSQRAVAVYDAIIFKKEDSPAAKEGKGLALIALGDYDTPVKIFEDVMALDSTRWKTLNALGILFTTRNMQPEAQQYFNEALKHHPGNPSIMNNLGLSQALELNFDGATETLEQASALALPDSAERKRIELNTALVYASAGRLDEAQVIAEQYLQGAALDNNLGLYAHLAKDDQLARAFLNKALNDSKIHYSKAWENLEEISHTSPADEEKKKQASKAKPKPVAKKETPPKTESEKLADVRKLFNAEEAPAEATAEPEVAPQAAAPAPAPETAEVPPSDEQVTQELSAILEAQPAAETPPAPAPAFGESAQAGLPAITLPGALSPSAGQ